MAVLTWANVPPTMIGTPSSTNSRSLRTPTSGLVSSSRTTALTLTLFPSIISPPLSLTCLMARFTPSSWTFATLEPFPVMLYITPTLIVSSAARAVLVEKTSPRLKMRAKKTKLLIDLSISFLLSNICLSGTVPARDSQRTSFTKDYTETPKTWTSHLLQVKLNEKPPTVYS